jgi:hypothetical protein
MPVEIVHIEIPADDTTKGREFWGSLFGWTFESYPGPSEYHMTRISDRAGAAITNMEPASAARAPTSASRTSTRRRAREGARRGRQRTDARAEYGLVCDL